jgi:Lipoprotein confined to pathogenic Mycobacterium
VTKSLGAQSLQPPRIGADLENIAASLAEAQKASLPSFEDTQTQVRHAMNEINAAASNVIPSISWETPLYGPTGIFIKVGYRGNLVVSGCTGCRLPRDKK